MIDVPTRVKDALREGRRLKNYKFNVLDDEDEIDFTIDNDTLVSESVKIDERMCSDDTIKFGLCEGSSLEFQYFNHPNIRNRRIQAFIDVQYVNDEDELAWHEIPMGYFTVNECSLQYSTGIQKVVCYNKLMSTYLDAKANIFLDESYSSGDLEIKMFDIMHTLLKGYAIEPDYDRLAPVNPLPPHRPDELIVIDNMSTCEGTLEFRFNQNYGIDNPFNYYMWRDAGAGATNTGHLILSAQVVNFGSNEECYGLLNFLKGSYEEFELVFYNYLVDTLNAANLTRTGEEILENILSVGGWPKFCSLGYVHLDQQDPVIRTVVDYYSTIQYNYDVAHNVTNCAGPAKDLLNRIFPIHRNTATPPFVDSALTVRFPYEYGMVRESGSTLNLISYYLDPTFGLDVHLTGTFYTYYTNSALTTTSETELEPIKINATDDYVMDSVYQDWPLYFEPISYTELNDAELVTVKISDMPDFTLRDIATAIFETQCQYGQLDRVTDLFGAVELNFDTLFPSETLYPDDELYPQGKSERTIRPLYSKLWTDTEGGQSFRYLIITYKGYDEEEGRAVEYTLQRTVNPNGTTDYNCSDNWLFKNLIWTAEQVADYADVMVAKMRDITWFPFEMWCAGLPYVETGDKVEVITKSGDTQASYILQRQLDGIQNLQDTYINGTLDVF